MKLLVAILSALLLFTVTVVAQTPAELNKHFDFSKLLASPEYTGFNGVFDKNYSRLQIHFETIKQDSSVTELYHITGASRHRNVVTPFSGKIKIEQVKPAQVNITKEFPEAKFLSVEAVYELNENSKSPYSGSFTGKLQFIFQQNKQGAILPAASTEFKPYSNFTYNGIWKHYKSGSEVWCAWGLGHLPVPAGVDVGENDFEIAEKYRNNGWKKDKNQQLTDNPK
ncbi:MAG: hypothetical protein LPK21_05615, partial [Hymenobacteraceae bacterium]|nr:hypothetical protein [Hymenobacteraceae bacterium]